MERYVISCLLLSVFSFFVLHTPIEAIKQSYIVYLGPHSHGPNPTPIQIQEVEATHYSFLSSLMRSEAKAKSAIFYSYTRNINGFAAILDEQEASEVAKQPNVLSVFLNKGRKLHTTHSWDFLRVERNGSVPQNSIWTKARYGEDTIIANLDTGVWPESKSFSDVGLGPVPSRWRGSCQDDAVKMKVRCNRKLIGAKYFNKGYLAYLTTTNISITAEQNATLFTSRDNEGHGSHTLSTAGGSFVDGASVFNNGRGTAKGGSPKARVAAYKVCWPPVDFNECFDADILAAFDAAIGDGVDVISVSLGGAAMEYFQDGISIGAFHAVKSNIVVVASAGNGGPTPTTVSNVSPWIVTVAASTLDREFSSVVALGNRVHLKGQSLSAKPLPSRNFYPLITGARGRAANASAVNALLCLAGTLDPRKVRGKILVCRRGLIARLEKGVRAAEAGAVGMILANAADDGNDIVADPHFLPASHVGYSAGQSIFSYIKSTKNPVGYITAVKTQFGIKPSPAMASFSSRGPNLIEPTMLKPDITAPGVGIIAAYTEAAAPSDMDFDKRRTPYNIESGTSMSCPHVSGVVGLLKTLHPDWSTAAIKSAIMTTATTRDDTNKPIVDYTLQKATPFAYGSGHINPNSAADPGLVYDITINDYLDFLCSRGYNQTQLELFAEAPYKCPKPFSVTNFNYPSITIPNLKAAPVTVTRKVKNVGKPGTYSVSVKTPPGVLVSVNPKILTFTRVGEEKTYTVVVQARPNWKFKDYVYGSIKWSDGKHNVRSPLVVNHVN